MANLTYAQVAELLNYDPETGVFTWKPRPLSMFTSQAKMDQWNRKYAGKRAGSLLPIGYVYIRTKGNNWRAGRLAWFLTHGYWPNQIDHINGDRTDDRIANLRDVPNTVNMKNLRRRKNVKGMTGVNWHKRFDKWHVQIGVSGKVKSYGYFFCFGKAAKARKAAEKLHGFHPNHGSNRRPPAWLISQS